MISTDDCAPSGIRIVVPSLTGAGLHRSAELTRARGVVASLRRGDMRVSPEAYSHRLASGGAYASVVSGPFLALLLRRHVQRPDILAWAASLGELPYVEAWAACPRADWLVHIAQALSVEWRCLVRAACAAARHAIPLWTGPRHLQSLLGHLEALLDDDPRDFGPDDRDVVIRSVGDADFDDMKPGAERAVYWAAKAYVAYLGVLAESQEIPGEEFRRIVAGAVEHAVHHVALSHDAAAEEDDLDEASPTVVAAHVRVAGVVRGVLTWEAASGHQGGLLRHVEQWTMGAERRAA